MINLSDTKHLKEPQVIPLKEALPVDEDDYDESFVTAMLMDEVHHFLYDLEVVPMKPALRGKYLDLQKRVKEYMIDWLANYEKDLEEGE